MLSFELFTDRLRDDFGLLAHEEIASATGLYDDLGLDSFDAFRLLLFVETIANIDIPPDIPPALFSVGDAYRYYVELAQTQPGVSP